MIHLLSYQNFMVAGNVFEGLNSIDAAYDFAHKHSSYGTDTRIKHVRAYIADGYREIRWRSEGVALFQHGLMYESSGSLRDLPRLRLKTLVGEVPSLFHEP